MQSLLATDTFRIHGGALPQIQIMLITNHDDPYMEMPSVPRIANLEKPPSEIQRLSIHKS